MNDVVAVDGRIEAATDGVLRGWVWRRDGAEEIRLAVTVDGELVASEVAGEERDDLVLEPGEPAGRGFRIALPDALVETGDRRIGVHVLPETVPLPAEVDFVGTTPDGVWATTVFAVDDEPPAAIAPGDGTPDAETPPPPRRMALESVSSGAVVGWLRSRKQPPREAVLHIDGREVARAPANIRRSDLAKHCYGFRIEIPASLRSGGPHAAEVRLGRERFPIHPGELLPTTATPEVRDAPDLRFVQRDEEPRAEPAPPVLLGRDGWLFPVRDEAQHRWDEPLDPSFVSAFAALVAGWASGLEALDIPYVLAFLPARERLERDRLPPGAPEPGPGPVPQLLAAVADGTALDLAPALRRARRAGEVSLRTDPSLSPRGALVVARALAAAAADVDPRLPLVPRAPGFHDVPGVRGRWAGRAKVERTADGLRELPGEAVPMASYGETAALPGVEAAAALRLRGARHLTDYGDGVTIHGGGAADGAVERAFVVGRGLPWSLGTWLASAYHRTTVLDEVTPPLREIELDSPDVVLHVLDEADVRLVEPAR